MLHYDNKEQKILNELNSNPFLADLARGMVSPDIGEAASLLADAPEEMESLRSLHLCGEVHSDHSDLEPLPTW